MIELIARTNELAKPWADAMAAVLWQSTILVAAVALVCWALRRHSPAVRYWLWVAVSAKLLLLPFWSVEVAAPAWWSSPAVDRATPPTAFATPQGAIPPTEHKSNIPPIGAAPMRARVANPGPPQPTATVAWQTWLLAVWVIVVLFQGARTIVQLSNLKRLLAGSHPANDGVAMLVADCARQILLVHTPRVRQTDADGSPFVCCMWRPTLLLPAWDSPPLNAAAQRQIVLHELAHIRRGDLWTIWVIHLMRVVYWFHPLAHWISYRANLERELACDQLAMQHSGASAAAYARTLVLAAGRGMQPIVLTAAGAAQLDGGAGGAGDP